MSYTSDEQFPQKRLSDTNPVIHAVDLSMVKKNPTPLSEDAWTSSTTKEAHTPLQSLRVQLGLDTGANEQEISIDALLSDLFSSQWMTRVAAIRTLEVLLGKQASVRVIRALTNALQDSSEHVRAAAAQALAKLEERAPKVDLILAIGDRSWKVRASVVHALGELGSETPIETLINALKEDDEPAVRMAAVSALGRLKRPELLEHLLAALQDDDPFVRLAAVQSLGKQEKDIPIKLLIQALKDEDEDVRLAVLEVLGSLGEQVPIGAVITALEDENEDVRLAALSILREQEEYVPEEYVPLEPLLLALQDPSEQVRNDASRLLARFDKQIPRRASPEFLLRLLRPGNSEDLRAIAAWALGEQRTFAAKEALLGILHDPSEEVRSATVWALQQLEVDLHGKLSATLLPGRGQLHMPGHGMHTPEFIASTTHFLSALAAYLEDKRGFVHQELWKKTDESILVIFCSLQNNGDCLQKTVLDTIASSTSTEGLEALLESEDEIVQRVARHARQFLGSRRWTELFITSLELAQSGGGYMDREIPTRIIFCGIGFWHMKVVGGPVLQQVLAVLKREAICDYALKLGTQREQEAPEHETRLRKAQFQDELLMPSRQSHTSWLGKALRDIKIWYTSSRETISHFSIPNHQSIYSIFL
jgi:HEAT repeat protein